jgi:hypothetical protein
MDFYEDVVNFYLTAIEKCAVIPQVEILRSKTGESWSAYPDFLAVDFQKQEIQIIEVTKAWKIASKLAPKLNARHREHVEDYIRKTTLRNCLSFPIVWRFFVRGEEKTALEAHAEFRAYREGGGDVRVTPLQQVFKELSENMP